LCFDGYREDIIGFANDVLGYVQCRTIEALEREVERQKAIDSREPPRVLWPKQIEILEAICSHPRVAVRSGQKVSKSFTAAIAALWFYCCFPEARVLITAKTARQVDGIIWREVRKLRTRAKLPIAGNMGSLARTGLKSDAFCEITGFTARETEAAAGVSGAYIMYLADESSGIDDRLFEAFDGNTSGSVVSRIVMFSNPTRTSGEFFEAFHKKSESYFGIQVSSEETPNAVTGKNLIPGLATRAWIERRRAEYGEDSPFFMVRVKGEFVQNEQDRIISLHEIQLAEERWDEAVAEGRLHIGVDPAGPGQGGDDSVFVVRRGKKVIAIHSFNGLSADAHLAQLLGLIQEHGKLREIPVVVLDALGDVGKSVGEVLDEAKSRRGVKVFDLAKIRASDNAIRSPQVYGKIRDELWANLAKWLRNDGAIPQDARLAKELHAPEWVGQVDGCSKATPKDELRKLLDGSPDRADALALAVWDPVAFREDRAELPKPANVQRREIEAHNARNGAFDPYAAEEAFRQ
jgi:hypothetical protein